jgi:large subunit ribosomal protein L7/L12
MSKLEKLVEELSNLTVLEAADLAKKLEEKWGVSAAAPMAMAMAAPSAAAAVEEKTEFDVMLVSCPDDKKLSVIKEVRTLKPELTLPDAKKLVESAPQKLMEAVSKDAADKAKKALETAGAKVEVK